MMKQPLVGLTITVLVGLSLGCMKFGTTRRQLYEFGEISVPARLKSSYPWEQGTFALFSFDRSAMWPMGSNRPVPERLVVAVWTPASRDTARAAAIKDAQDRTEEIQWRRDGEYTVGEGTHSVNTAVNPAWVLVRDFEERSLTIAYMAWKKDASLDKARRIVSNVYDSFRPAASPADYLAIARERPAKMRAARLSDLESALAARNVRLTLDGPPVEQNGTVYALFTDDRLGRTFIVLHPLGALPLAEEYRHLRPPPPDPIANWPSVVWFAKKSEKWEFHGIDGYALMPDQMTERVGALHANDAIRAHFYAVETGAIDDLELPEMQFKYFDRAAPVMAKLFKEGKLIQ